ncbi:MAG TPA: endonuclease NucS domain-containing protein [Nitrospirota bacterium]|jgi:hypothetical protein
MAELNQIEEFERFPLRYAYEFLSNKGFKEKAEEIKQSKDSYKSYTSTLKRGKIIAILENNNLLEDFIDKYWPLGKTEKGRSQIKSDKRIHEEFLGSDKTEEEIEEERIEETSFAYENDLRDYLSSNLSIIEKNLKLCIDKDGKEGVEYSVDDANKKIDILAIDKNKVPVVIELKVSRGYERVIGQCLYYKNRIKQLFGTPKVRIIIIAREITSQLQIATEDLHDVELYEYKLSVKLEKIMNRGI